MTTKSEKIQLKAECLKLLPEHIAPGAELYFVHTYFSSRGFSTHGYRILTVIDGSIRDLTYLIGNATGTYNQARDEIRVSGVGEDKRFRVCYTLARNLGGEYATTPFNFRGA